MMARANKPMILPWPRTSQVGAKTITVMQVPNLIGTEGNCGSFCMGDLTIRIDAGLLPINKTETFIHEDLEAINKIWLSDSLTHEDINRLGEALTQVLGDMGIEIDWSG